MPGYAAGVPRIFARLGARIHAFGGSPGTLLAGMFRREVAFSPHIGNNLPVTGHKMGAECVGVDYVECHVTWLATGA